MGKISDLFNGIRNSKKWGVNSRLYRDIVKEVNKFEEKLNKPVTYENIDALSDPQLYMNLKEYLEKRKNPITQKGKERYEYVKKALDLYELTDILYDEVKDYQAEGKTLLEALESKNKGIDITNEENEIVGEGASKRIKFKYRGKLGSFFAIGKRGVWPDKIEDENTRLKNEDEKLWTKMKNSGLVIENDNLFFRKNPEEDPYDIERRSNKIIENIGELNDNQIIEKIKTEYGVDISGFDESKLKKVTTYYRNIGKAVEMRELNDNQIIEKIKTEYGGDISEFDESEIKKVTTYYRNIGKIINMREKMKAAHADDYYYGGYEERCVAATRLANMLNMEDKVADAKIINVLDNGVKTKGVFIDNNGMDSKSHNGRVSMMSKDLDLTAGSFQRDINRLQVFDILSGNMDRNSKNFAYQISEKTINGKYSVIGLHGIDNGIAFGNINKYCVGEISPSLERLTMIDEDILNSLKEITSNSINYQLSRLLNSYEMNTIIERRDLILAKIQNDRIRVVKANEWGNATLEDTQKSSYYREIKREIANMEFDENAATDEIVDSYDMAVKRVEEYNKKHPENKQAFPEKPENYDLYKEQKQWREANSEMVEYEKNLASAKTYDTKLSKPPMGYDKYKAEKEIYTYLSQKQVYDSEIAKTGKSSMKEPKEPENFAERRKALYLQSKMEAYKEDFEKQMEDYENAATDEIVDSYDMAVKRVEEYNKKHPENKQAFPEKPENYDLYKEQKQWREANSEMVEYEKTLARAKTDDTKLPKPPMGYSKYKAEKKIYTYLSQKQVYDSEIAKTGKSSMKEPKEPAHFAERRKALYLHSYLQPKMEAYKEDFENNFEKQMEDYEKQVREAASAKKPLPKMPAGYLEYKKLKEMENGRVEVSLDDLSNTSKNISRMKTDANQPKHKMGMAPNSK